MDSGVKPVRPDHRDRSFPRTFGSVSTFPAELNLEWRKTTPDQNAEGFPFGCTGYTQADVAGDEDRAAYDPAFTYEWTRKMEGTYPEHVGCDMRQSLASTIVYGLKEQGEPVDQALNHRRGAYYNVIDQTDLDCFDDVRSALLTNQRTVSVASPWFREWATLPKNGIVPKPESQPASYHNWKVCGWKQIKGEPYLIGKPWQGARYGHKGYIYFSREVFNAIMSMHGAAAFTLRKAADEDYVRIKLETTKALLSYLRLLLAKLISQR